MIWLTWRQHRLQLAAGLIGLALVAMFVVTTGLQIRHAVDASGVSACLQASGRGEFVDVDNNCARDASQVAGPFQYLSSVAVLLLFVPLLAGIFWGAPLVARETELGTHRLTWTQGLTPLRWAAAKFGLVVAAVLVLAAAYTVLVSWWMAPLTQLTGFHFDWEFFDLGGVAPMGQVLFALALGVFAGTVTRRVLPAMAVTLVGFVGVRLVVELLLRPRFLAPLERRFPVIGTQMPNQLSQDWVLSRAIYSVDGVKISGYGNNSGVCSPEQASLCPYPPGSYNLYVYQPADRFWLFQTIEAGLYVILAAALLALAIHWVRRRVS